MFLCFSSGNELKCMTGFVDMHLPKYSPAYSRMETKVVKVMLNIIGDYVKRIILNEWRKIYQDFVK